MSSELAASIANDAEQADAEVGLRVHTLMWERRITQEQLGKRIGVHQTGLGRRLRGKAGWTVAELKATARELQVTVAYLVGETDERGPEPKGPLSDYSADGLAPIVGLFTRQPIDFAGTAA
jgi:transcriptional regulator with XRE-family HTH domain